MSQRAWGILSGMSTYVLWGVLGVFWVLLKAVPAVDVLAYRFLFSLLFMALILTIQRSWSAFFHTIKALWQSKKLIWVVLSATVISINWGTYIYMVGHGQATEASLGYYIMPLLNIIVAIVFFKEKLTRLTSIAVSLVVIGVALFAIQSGKLPFNTLLLALSFCIYGVIKKKIVLPASFSLTLETLVCCPIALGYLWLGSTHSFFSFDSKTMLLLALSGIVTAVPLLLFTVAAKNLDFLTLSFIQSINPTIQLVVAIFLLHEAFNPHKLIVFAFIWSGVIIFTIDSIQAYRKAIFDTRSLS